MTRAVDIEGRGVRVNGRSVGVGSAIPDSQVLRTNDDGSTSLSADTGIVINPNVQLNGIKAEISNNTSGLTTAYIRDTNDNILGQTDISNNLSSGDTIRVDNVTMDSGTDYVLSADAGGSTSYTLGFLSNASYNYTTAAFDITGRWRGDNTSETDTFQAFNNIRNLDY